MSTTQEQQEILHVPEIAFNDQRLHENEQELLADLSRQGHKYFYLVQPNGTKDMVIISYTAVEEALTNKTILRLNPAQLSQMQAGGVIDAEFMVLRDGEYHDIMKRIYHGLFTPKSVRKMQDGMEQSINKIIGDLDEKLLALQPGETLNLAEHLSSPFPIEVIAKLLDLPEDRYEDFARWAETYVIRNSARPKTDDEKARIGKDLPEAVQYMTEHIVNKKNVYDLAVKEGKEAPEDVFTEAFKFINEHPEETQNIEMKQLVANAIVLLIGGHETTQNLISGLVLMLAEHPEFIQQIDTSEGVEKERLMANLLNEVKRFYTPLKHLRRFAPEEIILEKSGITIPANKDFMASIMGANFDTNEFGEENITTPNISEDKPEPIVFGQGVHYCLGSPLANLEMKIVLPFILNLMKKILVENFQLSNRNILLKEIDRVDVRLNKHVVEG